MQRFRYCFIHYIVFFILFTCFTASAQQRQSNVSLGYSLSPTKNSSWPSPSGLYAFGFYQLSKGRYGVGIFIDGIPQKTVVWTAKRDDPPVFSNATLFFNFEGRIALRATQGPDSVIADVSKSASSASMLDSGNFMLYNSNREMTWESFRNPTDTILPTQRLSAGAELFPWLSETDHSTGRFRLKMQHDGHLVQYPTNSLIGHLVQMEMVTTSDKGGKMQRLPLRFGRRRLGDSETAFINVDAESSPGKAKLGKDKKDFSKAVIILSCSFVAVIILILAIFGIFICRYRVWSYKRIPGNSSVKYCEDIAPLSFSYAELEKMTDGFKEEVGKGASGTAGKDDQSSR
ncbi:G-type lectin S-receptor-like serine/threonine-protein kinase [Melia azedarach]|uniref:G-type lectin S-receptor-like serine/threonine-protein kinase n=1 Tax=Melia azedarach TaxID=155640 RepID=A0ACC1XWF5_MELAZ|nr:G-type lectin S-receptor-like serine/threonine-protein kinase [Melia azedarach]